MQPQGENGLPGLRLLGGVTNRCRGGRVTPRFEGAHRHTGRVRFSRMLVAVLSVLGLAGGISMLMLQPAGAALGACGTEASGSAVYIDCVVPPATSPFTTYHDGDFINMSMGPNTVFSPSDALGGQIVAIECEYTTGSAAGDPPNANFCDAQTAAGGYPLAVNNDGSFDYYVANGSAGNGSLMNTYAIPGSTFPGASITCDTTHPCVWYVGENFNSFTAPHVFSNPFLMAPAAAGTAPAITSASATTFTEGSAGTFSVTTTGTPTPTITKTMGTLPTGVTLTDNGNGTATLAGTPATGTHGSYPITIQAANGVTPNATQPFTLTVNTASSAPSITSANSTIFTVGSAGTFSVTTTGSPKPAITKTAGTLPTGVTLTDNGNGTATLAGTPGAGTGGDYTITIQAANGTTPNATQSFTLHVHQAPAITSANSTIFTVGSAGTFGVTTTGAPAPAVNESGTLPTGVTLIDNGNGTATLSGTPGAGTGGDYTVTISANNGVGTAASQSFTLHVHQPPAITSANSTIFTEGSAGTFSVTTSGSPAPAITKTTGTLPTGVTLTDNGNGTATLAGTPATGTHGPYPITLSANNGVGTAATQGFTLTVSAGSSAPSITSANSTIFTVGSAGTFSVAATGSPTPAITKTAVTLPTGVTLTDNGNGTATLAGTPGAGTGGDYTITIQAANGTTPNATQSFTLHVHQAPAITSANSTIFTVGSAGTFGVTTTGAPAPAVNESGTLPTGVTLIDNGNGTATLSGTPGAGTGGDYTVTISANNGVGTAASQSFTLHVHQPPAITSANSTIFTEGSAGTFSVTTSGSPAPAITKTTGTLPTGVTLTDNGNGTATLAGTPATGTHGPYPITLSANNGVGTAATQGFTLTVSAGSSAPSITSANSTIFTVGSAGTFSVTTTGSPKPAITKTAGTLPTGVTLTDNGNGTATLAGTPGAGTGG